MTEYKKQKISWCLFIGFICSVILGVFLTLMCMWLTRPCSSSVFDFSQTGQIGDTIGGITAPFIGVAGAILTFLAFYIQFKANETHNRQFATQSSDKRRDRLEAKILYLIKENRNIVRTMSIQKSASNDDLKGIKCFSKMYLEFKIIFQISSQFFAHNKEQFSDKKIAIISYVIFHNGVGTSSNSVNTPILKNIKKIQGLFDILEKIQKLKMGLKFDKATLKVEYDKETLETLETLGYVPFDGHNTRLGQYYRNLFHILKFTTNISSQLLKKSEKREIIKLLRSQQSGYEQIFVYLNSLSPMGKPLAENGYIEEYGLIKNIPLPLVDFTGDIHEEYPNISFEWDEITTRRVA